MDQDSPVLSRRARPGVVVMLRSLVFALIVLLPIWGMAGGISLDSREYKLMLQPDLFAGADPRQAVQRFVKDQLVPAVRDKWNANAADELAAKGLDLQTPKIVQFLDSPDCVLYRHGFAWRTRVDTDEHGKRAGEVELTLKFRSPDVLWAAGMPLKAKKDAKNQESKFEEDLGPVAARSGPMAAGVVANPRTARSQFSRSTKVTASADALPANLAGIATLYPGFEDELRDAAGSLEMSTPLEPSPEFRELVYESSKLKLVKDVKAEFALTLWYKGTEPQAQPTLAEISFKYHTVDGEIPVEAARRALDLFLVMQNFTGADPAAPTKTAYVACDRPS